MKKLGNFVLLTGFMALVLAFTACGGGADGGNSGGGNITYTVSQTGGTANTANTTGITLAFSGAVAGLTAADITITNGTGSVTKGNLTGSGESWSLAVTVNTAGNVTVKITKSGIEAEDKTVTVYKAYSGTPGLAFEPIGSPATAYRVRKGTVTSNTVTIPSTYNGLPVTEIGSVNDNSGGAFSDWAGSSISIPESVKTIGNRAFYDCTNLRIITIPEGVTIIGSYAFSGCTGLTDLTIPGSVTTIGSYAFYGCTGLTRVIFSAGSAITSANFGVNAFPGKGGMMGSIMDGSNMLKDAYLERGIGSYRFMNGGEWRGP